MSHPGWQRPISGFEWDTAKAKTNWKKHRVHFEEAVSVFADPLALEYIDESHSKPEETRFLTLGMSVHGRLLLVANCERGDKIRLITARAATARERASNEAKDR